MVKYLDPKADLTFKKIFGEHKDLLISLINALLPLKEDEQVEEVEYLTPELVPDNFVGKNSIVDVRCKDTNGRQFLVEMQMLWTPAFQQRVLFNASKAFVRQLDKNRKFELLQPVYSLNLVNDIFQKDLPDRFIHNYNMVHEEYSDRIIEGLHLTFIELPKFQPHTIKEKKMTVLWLKFLTEIDENTTEVPHELLENPVTCKALENVEESAMTKDEMWAYEEFWDKLGAERLLLVDSNKVSRAEGKAEGHAEGHAEGLAEGLAKGKHQQQLDTARKMMVKGLPLEDIMLFTGLTEEQFKLLGK